MGFLFGLLLLVLFFRVFVGLSVGLFKLLIGLIVVIALFTIAPFGLLVLGLIVPLLILGAFLAVIGFVLKTIF